MTDEATLREFFESRLSASELDVVWASAFKEEPRSDGTMVRRLRTKPLGKPFLLQPEHVLALIDAVQAGALGLRALDAICFALEASDEFEWDTDTPEGERVAQSLFWLGSPEVNYPLTAQVVQKIRHFVASGVETFTPEDLKSDKGERRVINKWERGA
jgi:hypothetical protein